MFTKLAEVAVIPVKVVPAAGNVMPTIVLPWIDAAGVAGTFTVIPVKASVAVAAVEILPIVLFDMLFTCAAVLVTLMPVMAPVLAAVVLIELATVALPMKFGEDPPPEVTYPMFTQPAADVMPVNAAAPAPVRLMFCIVLPVTCVAAVLPTLNDIPVKVTAPLLV